MKAKEYLTKLKQVLSKEKKSLTTEEDLWPEELFIGAIYQIVESTPISIYEVDTPWGPGYISDTEVEVHPIRITVLQKITSSKYKDLKTDKIYGTDHADVGDVFVSKERLISWSLKIPEDERAKNTTKEKVLTRLDNIIKTK